MHRAEWYPLRIASVEVFGFFVFLNWAGMALVALMVG